MKNLGYAVGCGALLAALYAGVYYALVERIDYQLIAGFQSHVVRYRIGEEWSESIFAPMHDLDRKIRPGWWAHEATGVSGAQLTRERNAPGAH
jgi:hypothetical protein